MSGPEVAKRFFLTLGLTLLLYLGGVSIPVLGILFIALVPYAAVAFGLRHGNRGAAAVSLAAAFVLYLMGGSGLALGYLLLALMAILLLFLFGRGWSVEAVVSATAMGTTAAGYALLLYLLGSLSHVQQVARSTLTEHLEASLRAYEKAGFSAQGIEALREQSFQVVEIALSIMPALAFVGSGVVILLNLLALYRSFPHLRGRLLPADDLKEWRSPEPLVWCFIAGGFSLFLPSEWGLRTLALNVFLVSAGFYFFQGLAIIAYFFHHRHVPLIFRGLSYLLIALEQLLTLLVVGLGLFDLWGDFRGLKKKDLNPNHAS